MENNYNIYVYIYKPAAMIRYNNIRDDLYRVVDKVVKINKLSTQKLENVYVRNSAHRWRARQRT